ncbi:hepcidin-like [Vanacampus margaritifer]
MKTFNFAVAVVFLLTVILIQQSRAYPPEQNGLGAGDDDVLKTFEMQSEQPKMDYDARHRHVRSEKRCRWCCGCCGRPSTWCGLCCDW